MIADDDPRLAVDYRPRECFTAEGRHKQTYDRVQAKRKARLMGKRVQAYKCRMCENWHVGNKPESPRAAP